MAYCIEEDLTEYILAEYLEKFEEISSGIVDRKISTVSGEIDDALRGRYQLPLTSVPETLKRINAVLAAYQAAGAITSLVETAALSDNEFLFLQDMAKQARKDLDLIRQGKMDIGLEELGEIPVSSGTVRVSTPAKHFNLEKF